MIKDLSLQIDEIVINTKARMLAVVRQSISEVVDEAQVPVAKGGRMRVDTGFLRASAVASLNIIPSGDRIGRRRLPGETSKPLPEYAREDNFSQNKSINTVLANMKLGDVFYFGWTAHYAKHREVFDGFLESAIQNWQGHVDKAVAYFRNKDAKK